MSYCSAMARSGSWKTGSAVTSVMRRPPRKTLGACFRIDSTYSRPLRAGMAPTFSRNAPRKSTDGRQARAPVAEFGRETSQPTTVNEERAMDANVKKTVLRMIPYGLYVLTARARTTRWPRPP